MDCGETVSAGAGLGQGHSASLALSDNTQTMLTVVLEVEPGRGSGKKLHTSILRGSAAWESLLGEGDGWVLLG